jgi:hypothetical protein
MASTSIPGVETMLKVLRLLSRSGACPELVEGFLLAYARRNENIIKVRVGRV